MAASANSKLKAQHASNAGALGQPRPVLLPYNRKLRNLKAISLRNLGLEAATAGRPRGKTIDDDADPHAFVSPTKLRALREEQTLEHSHSSSDLRRDHALETQSDTEARPRLGETGSPRSKVQMNGGSVKRRPARPRRRSTLDWSAASSVRRQEKLENVKDERMANVFYSIYVAGINEPVYISEIAEQTMDPTFRSIDLGDCNAGVLRQTAVTIRFWSQSLSSLKWHMLQEWHVSFEQLYFLGPDVDRVPLAFEKNTVLFYFLDGVYTIPSLVPFAVKHASLLATKQPAPQPKRQQLPRTSTFDALLKMAKLTDSIEDALVTRNKLAAQLDRLLLDNRTALEERDHVTEYQDRCKTIVYARDVVVKQVGKAKKQIEEKRNALRHRRKLLQDDHSRRDDMLKEMHDGRAELPHIRDERQVRKIAFASQQRRIVEDVAKIFPVTSIGGDKTLAFELRGLALPNAEELDHVSAAEAAAALGYVAQATQLMSFYLGIPLPYHLQPMGSTSWITDPISLVSGTTGAASVIANALRSTEDKVYPLHQSRVARFRFEYGVFLLNKDIQLLLESGFGVRVLDIRHTLPNLKYLFYIATAGEGDLPARKAGGIRGLVKQSPRSSPSNGGSPVRSTGWLSIGGGKEERKDTKDATKSLRQLVQE